MKKLVLTSLFVTMVFIVTACGDDENSSHDQSTTSENQPAMSIEDVVEKMDALDYSVVDFDVLYADTEFEGEIEHDAGLVEAEFYYPLEEVDARGKEAFDAIFPFVQKLDVHYDMTDEEAIKASLEVFNLPENFLKAELEVKFKDGTQKTFIVNNNEM
ncbi:YusW family protein [Ornithinibacillus xuwenensis]|jgi:YusW-like protein|uniref:YusW family protein n=1 Tax=Ornithinibacillus xuwenensis TaxID=3144668 RepID=A0ABU9XHB8_9BACI